MAIIKARYWIVLVILGMPAVPAFSASASISMDDPAGLTPVAEQKEDQTAVVDWVTQGDIHAAVADNSAGTGPSIEPVDGQKVLMQDRFAAESAESFEDAPSAGLESDAVDKEDQMAEQAACARLIRGAPGASAL